MTIIITLVLFGWLVCSFFAYGLCFGYFSSNYMWQSRTDHLFSAGWALIGGPLSLIVALIFNHHLHWRLKPTTYEERLASFNKEYSILGESYFKEHHG